MTPHILPFAAFQKSWFSEVSWTFGGVSGNWMGQNEKKLNFVTVLARRFMGHPTEILMEIQACSDASHDTPHATFCCVSKSRFSDVSGTLHQGPWGPGEVQTIFFFKIFDWLDQTLPMTPHTSPFAAFQRSQFWEVLGTFRRGPWRPGEVETEFFFQNF